MKWLSIGEESTIELEVAESWYEKKTKNFLLPIFFSCCVYVHNKSFQIFIKMINKYYELKERRKKSYKNRKYKIKLRESLMKNLTCHVLFPFFSSFKHENVFKHPKTWQNGKFSIIFVYGLKWKLSSFSEFMLCFKFFFAFLLFSNSWEIFVVFFIISPHSLIFIYLYMFSHTT